MFVYLTMGFHIIHMVLFKIKMKYVRIMSDKRIDAFLSHCIENQDSNVLIFVLV